jgi:hypothetical protein
MSALAIPVDPDPVLSVFDPPSRRNGSRLWLLPVAVWFAVVALAALSDATPGACHGTGAQLRQQLSDQV